MGKHIPWFDTNRKILGEVVPLDTPLAITLTPSSICNFKCRYCMQAADHDLVRTKGFSFGFMSDSTFHKCLEQIKEFPGRLRKIEFYGMGEPLCNPSLPEMIAKVKAENICDTIAVMTNGALLNHDLSRRLINAGTDEIKISLQGISSAQYWHTSQVKINFARLVQEISYLYEIKKKCSVFVKIISNALSGKDREKQKFEQIFSPISDRYSIEGLLPLFKDIDYNQVAELSQSRYNCGQTKSRHICHFQFYRLIILSDGKVTACCDPLNAVYWGNINEKSLKSMWNSNVRRKFLKKLLLSQTLPDICKTCYMPNDIYSPKDDLEPFADEIIKRLEQDPTNE